MQFFLMIGLGFLTSLWSPVFADGEPTDEHHVLDTSEAGMKKIAHALGVECTHCHVAKTADGKPEFKAPSPFKATALHMKQHFIDSLRTADGEALECQTCHNGTAKFVPRDPVVMEVRLAEGMERRELMGTMRGFTLALGVKCLFCHAKAKDGRMDPTIPTKHRRMARYMYDTFTSLTLLDGQPVTCMTCHQGKTEFLPRHEE
jgi:cytochrome c553